MMASASDELPPPLRAALEQADVAGFTVEVVTTRADGWAHVALLSVGEVVTLPDHRLRLALWPGSTTAGNLGRTRRATLAAVTHGVAYRVRLEVVPLGDLHGPTGTYAVFDGRVVGLREDVVPYAVLESGIRFSLVDIEGTLARWRVTREWLRHLGTTPA